MYKKKTEHHLHEEHYHWHIDKFMKIIILFLFGLIILTTTLNILTNEFTKEEIVYKKCADVCGKKVTYKFYDVEPFQTPKINFNDRDECIASCNDMYLKLNGVD